MSIIEKKWVSTILAILLVFALFVPIQANAATYYDVYVGNQRVNSENASDVLGDGTVSYDVSTNTLTLNNATITGGGDDDFGYGIYYSGTTHFRIVSKGTNTIKVEAAHKEHSVGIAIGDPSRYEYTADFDVTINITEGSTLNVSGGYVSGGYYPGSFGIFNASGSGCMRITGKGDLNVKADAGAYSYGVDAVGDLHFNNSGKTTIRTDNATYYSMGVWAENIRISAGTLDVETGDGEYSYGLSTEGGNWQNNGKGNITIDGGDTVIMSGRGNLVSYGLYTDTGFQIEGGKIEISTIQQDGNSKALNMAPSLGDGIVAIASQLISGDSAEVYNAENNNQYKWFKAPAQTYVITYDFNGGEPANGVTNASDPIVAGTELELDTFPELIKNTPEGKELDGFEINGQKYDIHDKFTLNSNVSIRFIWKDAEEEDSEQVNQKEYTITNGDYTVIFTFDEGHEFELNFADVLKMTPEQLSELGVSQEEYDQILALIKDNVKDYGTLLCVYAIEINEGQLGYGGETQIKIKMTDEMKNYNSFKIIYLDDENNFKVGYVKDLKVEGDYITGTLPHLSAYALVGSLVEDTSTNESASAGESNNPKTGDAIYLWATLMVLSISGMTRMKNKSN